MKFIVLCAWVLIASISVNGQNETHLSKSESLAYEHFVALATSSSSESHDTAIRYLGDTWKPEYRIMVLELMYFSKNFRLQTKLMTLLQKHTRQGYAFDFNAWYAYLWNQEQRLASYYHKFKAELHSRIDGRFSTYFLNRQKQSQIRFDEIRWGGVLQDGIPPLRNPDMLSAEEAIYLEDDNIVFGIEVNGDARAYPKRILAWHELFTDTVGDEPVAGVYCTLCGTVILYKTTHNDVTYDLGTSGFLYRSNKLMYDKKTQSLWNTIWGKPVVGPLVDKGIELDYLSVVTTTWGAWKARHPETTVLSPRTGHKRNYGEGIAYHDYFADDHLMFNVPKVDKSLKNKQSILAIRFEDKPDASLAISTRFLEKNALYTDAIDDHDFVVLTDASGANRVYEMGTSTFKSYDRDTSVIAKDGAKWTLYEDRLEDQAGNTLARIPSFNAFWFGWKAAYPNTRLVK